ncbi:hypothetical protein [Helicobacter fennelliae]|uniref:hypothetical protein n=1 Tax=Helicobacter fennelliae TaxID=215 RepID=UPI0011BEDE3F|nr:hypothetical protein [Helicobacter fennelliae]
MRAVAKLRSKRESNSESTSSLLKRQPKANRHSDPESNPLRHSEALQKPKNPAKLESKTKSNAVFVLFVSFVFLDSVIFTESTLFFLLNVFSGFFSRAIHSLRHDK